MNCNFISLDDGQPQVDIVRCNPSFFGKPCWDTIIVKTELGDSFARLHSIFEAHDPQCNQVWQLARITWCVPSPNSQQDRLVGQQRIHEASQGHFIPLASIVRACHTIPTYDDHSNCASYINDLVDTDMYLRLNK